MSPRPLAIAGPSAHNIPTYLQSPSTTICQRVAVQGQSYNTVRKALALYMGDLDAILSTARNDSWHSRQV